MAVRLHADWMSQGDDRLLEYLEANGKSWPSRIADDERIRLSRPHLNVRLSQLESAGLVENLGNGVYQLTEAGEDYLAGEFDATELPPP